MADQLQFLKTTQLATTPVRSSPNAAGFDLHSTIDCIIPRRGSRVIPIGIQMRFPAGTYGRIAARSGLAITKKIDVGGGVIDPDFRGDIGVILFNHSTEDFLITRGDRVAQLVVEKYYDGEIQEVQKLDVTERGSSGFGLTGIGKRRREETKNITLHLNC